MMGTMPGITVGFVLSEKEKNKSVQVVFVFMFEKLKKAKRLDLFTDWPAGGGTDTCCEHNTDLLS